MTAAGDVRYADGPTLAFPPGRGNVLVPVRPAAASALGIALYTAHSRPVLASQWAMWLVARAGGARVLPGRRAEQPSWRPDPDAGVAAELWQCWSGLLDGPVDAVAVYERPQQTRPAVLAVLVAGRESVLVRLRHDSAGLDRERAVAAAAARRPPSAFRVPEVLGWGEVEGRHWIAQRLVSGRPHRVVRGDAARLIDDIGPLVEDALPRPDVPAHWRGCHGDLAPWNTIRIGRRSWLIDWEDARWAPPGTDELYFDATRAATQAARGRRPVRVLPAVARFPEAADAWRTELAHRAERDGTSELTTCLLGFLGAENLGAEKLGAEKLGAEKLGAEKLGAEKES